MIHYQLSIDIYGSVRQFATFVCATLLRCIDPQPIDPRRPKSHIVRFPFTYTDYIICPANPHQYHINRPIRSRTRKKRAGNERGTVSLNI